MLQYYAASIVRITCIFFCTGEERKNSSQINKESKKAHDKLLLVKVIVPITAVVVIAVIIALFACHKKTHMFGKKAGQKNGDGSKNSENGNEIENEGGISSENGKRNENRWSIEIGNEGGRRNENKWRNENRRGYGKRDGNEKENVLNEIYENEQGIYEYDNENDNVYEVMGKPCA